MQPVIIVILQKSKTSAEKVATLFGILGNVDKEYKETIIKHQRFDKLTINNQLLFEYSVEVYIV